MNCCPPPFTADPKKKGPTQNPRMIDGAIQWIRRQKQTNAKKNKTRKGLKTFPRGDRAVSIPIRPLEANAPIFTARSNCKIRLDVLRNRSISRFRETQLHAAIFGGRGLPQCSHCCSKVMLLRQDNGKVDRVPSDNSTFFTRTNGTSVHGIVIPNFANYGEHRLPVYVWFGFVSCSA